MSVIRIKVIDQQMVFINRPLIASGGVDEDYIEFEFSEEWDDLVKVAIFHRYNDDTKYIASISEAGKCSVPYALTIVPGKIYLGVVGGTQSGNVILTSELGEYEIVQGAYALTDFEIANPTRYVSNVKAILPDHVDPDATYYTITRNYNNNVTSDNSATQVLEYRSHVETLTYEGSLVEIVVTMGGIDITEDVYENDVILIPNVTGDVVITAKAINGNIPILNNLTHVLNSNTASNVTPNSAYNATLTEESGYTLSSVQVKMGSEDITSSVYSNGVINIPRVTNMITITAVATGSGPQPETKYSITNNLTHLTSNNNASEITEGYTYQATLSYESGYNAISSIRITMGGTDITSTAFNASNMLVNVQNVTGDVVITAVAGIEYSVTNVLDNATTNNSNQKASAGYDYRATITPNSGYEITTVQVKVGNAVLYRLLNGNETFGSGYSSENFYFSNGNLVIYIRSATIDNDIFINVVAEASVTPTGYTITNNLTNATNNNNATTISSGSSYTATISPASGYTKAQVIVRMNNTDITSSVYSNGTINIPNVTGNIQIYAVGVAAQSGLYMIARDLRNATSDKSDDIVGENSSLGEHISFGNFDVRTYFVEMGGVDITEDVTFVDENNTITIYISHVTGNVFISAYGSMSE